MKTTTNSQVRGGSAVEPPPDVCPQCKVVVPEQVRTCPKCLSDAGFPNVRAARRPDEVEALTVRFNAKKLSARARGVEKEFDLLKSEVDSSSRVIVSMPPLDARKFFENPLALYANYEQLLESNSRLPASKGNDENRFAVGAKLFGSYAKDIKYGILSLGESGLKNYGTVFLSLNEAAIRMRVSFLEENSFLFCRNHNIPVLGPIPKGFRATWDNRGELVAAKIEGTLAVADGRVEWQRALVRQGESRSSDVCIEAHIFGPFTNEAIDSIAFADPPQTRRDRVDQEVLREQLESRNHPRGAR